MPETSAIGATLGSLLPSAAGGTEGANAGGLFGQLVQGSLTEGQSSSFSDNPSPFIAQLFANTPSTAPSLPLQVGALDIALQGTEAEAVQVLSQTITMLYQKVTTEGLSFAKTEGRTAELANALTALGVPAEEALGMAKQIETMLALLERELEKLKGEAPSAETSTSLATMLMASLFSQTQAPQSSSVSSSVSIESISIEVSITQSQSIVVRLPEPTPHTRDALLGGTSLAVQKQNLVPLQTPKTPQLLLDVASDAARLNLGQTPTLQVTLNPEVNPEAVASETPANVAAVPQPSVQRLEAPKDISGKLMYVLKEAPTGATTVQAIMPVQEAETPAPTRIATQGVEALTAHTTELTTEQTLPTPLQNGATPTAATAMQRFAEHLKQAQNNQVAQQVVVAVQPLLKGEGGAVRMTINPPELGRIEIHIKIEAGQISGAIAATEPATVEHLARELPTLKQAFADAGLKLGEQGLSLMLNQNPHDQQRQPNPFAQQHNAPSPSRGDGEDDDAYGLETIISSAGPNRWVAPERVLDREV
jgi:hypothetical protein